MMKRLLLIPAVLAATGLALPITVAGLLMQRGAMRALPPAELEAFMQDYLDRLDAMQDVFPEEEE